MPSVDELCEFFGSALQGEVLRREEKPALALWEEDETALTWWHLGTDGDDVLYMDGEPWSRAGIE
jgi:hypothetical protein